MKIKVNGTNYSVDVDPNMPLLWVLRDELGLVGTKYGCGIGSCGACKVLLDNRAVQSCAIRIGDVRGEITTIEGITKPDSKTNEIVETWIEHQVAQCGYCQPGQVVAAVSLLKSHPNPDDKTIDAQMAGNLCRCGTYPRIRQAIKSVAEKLNNQDKSDKSQAV